MRRTSCCKKKSTSTGSRWIFCNGNTCVNYAQELRNEAIRLTMEEGYSIKGALWTAHKNEHQRALDYVDRSHECPLDPRSLRQQEDGSVRTEDSQTRAETCAGKVTFTQEKQSTNCSRSEESWSEEQSQRKRKVSREEPRGRPISPEFPEVPRVPPGEEVTRQPDVCFKFQQRLCSSSQCDSAHKCTGCGLQLNADLPHK